MLNYILLYIYIVQSVYLDFIKWQPSLVALTDLSYFSITTNKYFKRTKYFKWIEEVIKNKVKLQ